MLLQFRNKTVAKCAFALVNRPCTVNVFPVSDDKSSFGYQTRDNLSAVCQVIGFPRKVDIRRRVVIGIRHYARRRSSAIVNRSLIRRYIFSRCRGAHSPGEARARPNLEGKYRENRLRGKPISPSNRSEEISRLSAPRDSFEGHDTRYRSRDTPYVAPVRVKIVITVIAVCQSSASRGLIN